MIPKHANDLLYGTLNVLVLKALSWQPMHGYAISNRLRDSSGGTFDIDDAALYKALHRLEDQVHDRAGIGGVLAWLINTLASAIVGLAVGALVLAVVAPGQTFGDRFRQTSMGTKLR